MLAGCLNGDDVGVRQPRRGAGVAAKAVEDRIADPGERDRLQSDRPARHGIVRTMDDAS